MMFCSPPAGCRRDHTRCRARPCPVRSPWRQAAERFPAFSPHPCRRGCRNCRQQHFRGTQRPGRITRLRTHPRLEAGPHRAGIHGVRRNGVGHGGEHSSRPGRLHQQSSRGPGGSSGHRTARHSPPRRAGSPPTTVRPYGLSPFHIFSPLARRQHTGSRRQRRSACV